MASKKDSARKKARQAARQQAEQSQKGGSSTVSSPSGVDFFNAPENDKTRFAILPFKVKAASKLLPKDTAKGDLYFRATYLRHRDVGPEEHKVVCPTTFGKACPICEEFNKQKKGDAEWEDIKGLRPSKRELYLVAYKGKLQVMDMPWYWFGEQLDVEITDDDGEKIFFFPEDGIDILTTWKKDDFGSKAKAARFKKRKDDVDEELIEQAEAIDLVACVIETSYKDVEGMMHGVDPDDDDGDDDPDTSDEPEETDEPEDEPEEASEEETEDEPEDEPEPEEEPEVNAPKCFGKEYDEKDKDCSKKKCEHSKACQKAGKKDDSGKSDKKDKDKGKGKGKSEGKDECPSGHKYGKDFDDFDECDDCKNADKCEKAGE